jgi:hypothetical protein
MADVMKQFDANGAQIGVATPTTALGIKVTGPMEQIPSGYLVAGQS